MRSFFLLTLLVASAAGATPAVTLTAGDNTYGAGQTAGFGASACGSLPTLNWTADVVNSATTPTLCPNFRVWVTAGTSCGTAPDGGELTPVTEEASALTSTATGSYTFTTNDFDALSGGLCSSPSASAIDTTYSVCANEPQPTSNGLTYTCDTVTQDQPASPTYLRIDTIPPAPPTLSIEAFDGKATVTINPEVVGDYGGADLYYTFAGGDAGVSSAALDAGTYDPTTWEGFEHCANTSTNCDLTDLSDGQSYVFVAKAYDEANNVSGYSAPFISTVQKTGGFYTRYRQAGGTDGGCSSSGTGMALTAGGWAAMAWFLGRRRG